MGKKKSKSKLKAVKGVKNIKVKVKKRVQRALNKETKQPTAPDKPKRDAKGQLLPGETANPNGRPKGRYSLATILMDQLTKKAKGKSRQTQGEMLMKILIREAKKGNSKLLALVMERVDGKVPDRLITADSGPLSELDDDKLDQIINAGLGVSNDTAAE